MKKQFLKEIKYNSNFDIIEIFRFINIWIFWLNFNNFIGLSIWGLNTIIL